MTAAPTRGAGRQQDIPADSRTPLSSSSNANSHAATSSSSSSSTSAHATTPTPTPTSPISPVSPIPLTGAPQQQHQRGRQTNRYPDSLSRVPLHRRGTSKTYERLEDLLREAGYKETRVFTPEADRTTAARSAAEKWRQDGGAAVGNSVRGGVEAVVGFIAGLVSRGSSLVRDTAPVLPQASLGESHVDAAASTDSLHAWTPPSPLGHAKAKRVASKTSLSRHGSSESVRRRSHVDLCPDASVRSQMHELHQRSSQGLPHHSGSSLRMPHHPHRHLHQHQVYNNNYSSTSTTKSAYARPNQPNARAYLRHMASAPNIQPLVKRPSLSEASLRSHALDREHRRGQRRTFILHDEECVGESDRRPPSRALTDENEQQVHPPLPRNWMESVARALLSGVGGPVAAVTSDAASTRSTTKTVSTHKSATLSDKSNRGQRGRALTPAKPPLLCVQVQEVKASGSEGQVSRTRVMCRSTPTSRGNSRVRGSARDDRTITRSGGKRREGDKARNVNRGRGKGRDVGVVPSLARTKVEHDDWMAPRQRYSSGWGVGGSGQAYPRGLWSDESDDNDCEGDEDEDEDDEEGELGLDRLLVPARRQHSIQSLRRHLHRPPSQLLTNHHPSPRSGRASPGGSVGRSDWGDASWGTSRGRKWMASQGEEGEDGHGYVFSGSEARSGTRWRRGLAGLGQWTTSS